MTEALNHPSMPNPEENRDRRSVAVKADGYVLMKDIMYVPYDEATKTGGYYEYADGSSLEEEVIAYFVSVGAIGD